MAGLPSSLNSVMVGAGAGVASALGFAAPIGGTSLATPLFLLSGLPVVIAGLGWGTPAGGVAALVAATAIGLAINLPSAEVYLALVGGPLVILCHLLGLARSADPARPAGPAIWFPLGTVLSIAIGLVSVGMWLLIWLFNLSSEGMLREFTALFAEALKASGFAGDAEKTAAAVAGPAFYLAPPLVWVQIMVLNLWLGAHVTRISQRLARPWEDISAVALPLAVHALLPVAFVTAMSGGAGAVVAMPVLGALLGAEMLVGLAVIHHLTRGSAVRTPLLTLVWLLVFVANVLALPFLVLAALADAIFRLRARRGASSPPPFVS